MCEGGSEGRAQGARMTNRITDSDSDSGDDDLDIERNGSISRNRANRLRALLAQKKPVAPLAPITAAPLLAVTDLTPNGMAGHAQAEQQKQWQKVLPATAPGPSYMNASNLSSQKLASTYVRSAWSPCWQERLSRVDSLPSPFSMEAKRALDFSTSHQTQHTVLGSFAARLNELSPEKEPKSNVLQIEHKSSIGDASGGSLCIGSRLWAHELSRHVQKLIEQAESAIGNHAEEIRRAESVLETTLQELLATSSFHEHLLQNNLDFLSKDFERRATEMHRQYLCRVEDLKTEVLEKARAQSKQCEAAVEKKAQELAVALNQASSSRSEPPVPTRLSEKEGALEERIPTPSAVEQSPQSPLQNDTTEPNPVCSPNRPADHEPRPQEAPAAAVARAEKARLEHVVRVLQPQRLERTLTEVRDWMADSTGVATTPLDPSLLSPSSVAAEQGSVNGLSLLSLLVVEPNSPAAPTNGRQRSTGTGVPARTTGKAQALHYSAERKRLGLERVPLVGLSTPDGDLFPVKGARSPFRDSRPSPSVRVPRSNPASPSLATARSPLAAALSPRWRGGRAGSDPLESLSPPFNRGGRVQTSAQRRARSLTLGVGIGSRGRRKSVRVVDLFHSDTESEEDDVED